jgi:DHA1 family tetracycline resistance protein-like MFS transporter
MAMLAIGQGLLGPSVSGLLSRITPMSEQGAVFGTLSSAQTLARMISYSAANLLLGRFSTSAPYWFGFAVYLTALLVAGRFLANHGQSPTIGQPRTAETEAIVTRSRRE